MKKPRAKVTLECSVCGSRNYRTSKNSLNTTQRLELKKVCKKCGKTTLHKESK
ncbi:50S ribosomal protein L33 [Candidatus Saccharibacteria bacterium]|nr:50S ribosomal protein L33 [Candidatus Saccharibacteria bacterium]